MAVQTMGTMFAHETVADLFNKVQGHSSLAKLAGTAPVAFSGTDIFTFSMDSEIGIVAEGGAKANDGITVAPVSIVPIKVVYGARVTDEFMYASEEKRLAILAAFNEGFAKKLARGLDIMAMHGFNPKSGTASSAIGTNHLDTVTNTVAATAGKEDEAIEDAVALLGDYSMTGIAMSKSYAGKLAKITNNGVKAFPELAWGSNPSSVNGVPCDVNSTVSVVATDGAIVGDFANAFKYGIAKEIPLTVIPYGDPDNTSSDLAGHNQVFLRAEAYIGWGILDKSAFAKITV